MLKKKICLLGNEGAGKTSLATRFAHDSFSEQYKSTIGVKLFTKHIQLDANKVEFVVWDIKGGLDFYKQSSYYYNGAFAHIIVTDVSDQDSIKSIDFYYKESQKNYLNSKVLLCLSKIDLITTPKLELILKEISDIHSFEAIFATSSKEGVGVNEMFQDIAIKALQ